LSRFVFHFQIYPEEDKKPTLVHNFIAELEKRGKLVRNYTQNIDTLEDKAGISKVYRCHGGFGTASCLTCGRRVPGHHIKQQIMSSQLPYCEVCRKEGSHDPMEEISYGIMKPDVVFFHEPLPEDFGEVLTGDLPNTDLVIVIGSSLQVAPVSGFLQLFPGVPRIMLNLNRVDHAASSISATLLGDCQLICYHLAQRLGWELADGPPGKEALPSQLKEPRFNPIAREIVFESTIMAPALSKGGSTPTKEVAIPRIAVEISDCLDCVDVRFNILMCRGLFDCGRFDSMKSVGT
jgi:NAD-dependent SIR2 family protein deacetylase